MKINKKLELPPLDDNQVQTYQKYLGIKEKPIKDVHNLFYEVFSAKSSNNKQQEYDKVSKKLMSKLLDKLIKKEFTASYAVRANVKIQKHLKNNIVVEFHDIPFYDLETNTAYIMADSIGLQDGDKNKANYAESVKILLDNKNPLSQIVYKVCVIHVKKFKFRIEEYEIGKK